KRNQLDVRTELAQPAGGADERAAGAETGDEVRQASAGLLDDFRSGRVVVRSPVAVVVVLIRIEVPVRLGGFQPARLPDCTVGSLPTIRHPQPRAPRSQTHTVI